MTLEQAEAALAEMAASVPPAAGVVHLDLTGPVARIELDNPSAKNAITLEMMVELARAVRALGAWDGAVVVLSARGGDVFCSGGHLGQVRRAVDSPQRALVMAEAMTAVLDGLLALPQISVTALAGLAVGGGAELCTATDFRVADAGAQVHFVHARLGIAPGWGGTRRLVVHVGARRALQVLASAASLSADHAVEVGLVDRVGATAGQAVVELLAPMRALPAAAVRAVKAQVQAARCGDLGAEAAAFARVWGGPDHVAALHSALSRHT